MPRFNRFQKKNFHPLEQEI